MNYNKVSLYFINIILATSQKKTKHCLATPIKFFELPGLESQSVSVLNQHISSEKFQFSVLK